ncbi:MAG: tRNA (adenosine(37)-N6)-threonylcarbamoyltransferase complex dimerization subunit type 1 TsaB, partial [Candidatus Ornithomonoglobus sp.]
MKILAIDTSSFPASVAVTDGEYILGEYVIRNQRKHSQNIMPMVDSVLAGLGMDISEIDVFAVTVGPGSFTGLRIGISTIRAFAQAMKKPVVGISTLEALAYNFAGTSKTVIPMLDARRDEVFTAAYDNGKAVVEPCVMTVTEIAELFADGSAIYTGDGAIKHREEILAADKSAVIAAPNLSEVRASAAAALACIKAQNGEAVNYNEIRP